jgi:RNA polymerase sigma-70 factor (ECF subfamily)
MGQFAASLLAAVYSGDDEPSFPSGQQARGGGGAGHPTPALSDESAERTLVARIVSGDADAVRELVVQHFDPLARFATAMLGDRDAAEDVVQAVLTRLWERHDEFPPDVSVRAYLYRAVRNRALDAIDSDAVRARGHARLAREQSQRAEIGLDIEHPNAEALRVALGTLTERRRTALRLRYEEGLNYPDIATIMEISTGSAEQLVFHAIRALRAAMGVRVDSPKK